MHIEDIKYMSKVEICIYVEKKKKNNLFCFKHSNI